VQTDCRTEEERRTEQNLNNPKYIFRNWMGVLAYERAEEGDFSVINELEALLKSPYDEQSEEMSKKWYAKAPTWAQGMPGSAFLS
jgi:uncharacterized protein YdiU (UPF0061 family)